jgi:1-deoxy-D-xylulose-5-phosphate synthase
MAGHDAGISALRYPRDKVSELFASDCPPFEFGKARTLIRHDRPDLAVLGYGVMAIEAATAARELDGEYRIDVYDARFAKPVDHALLADLLGRGIPVITVEDHSIVGGFGAAVLEACADHGLDARLVSRLALPDGWIHQGSRGEQLAEAGLDAASIARSIRDRLDQVPVVDTAAAAPRPEAVRR